MDPALCELYETGDDEDVVSVILRLEREGDVPPGVRPVSTFGPIVTGRVTRRDIPGVHDAQEVFSMKAPRPLMDPAPFEDDFGDDEAGEDLWSGADATVPALPDLPEDGRGVVVGVCDWGLDFTHPNFRNPDGSTRLVALWDQGAHGPGTPEPFGYGRAHDRAAIDAALRSHDPFAALGYDPSRMDPRGQGTHGTHVTDIVAGNRREPGSRVGLARAADIVFVHLAGDRLGGLANFGDSVHLLEGLDFIRRVAQQRPLVLHLSAGKTGGNHRGDTPFERAVDQMLMARAGVVLVQSAGNYADAAMHTHARIGPDQSHTIGWIVARGDRTPNELEAWYSGQDVFDLTLVAPGGERYTVPLGERRRMQSGGTDWGTIYHRRHEPNSGENHIDIFLRTSAPHGRWELILRGREIVDGRFHVWIERDRRGRHQSRIDRRQATSLYTTNTICNSFRAIAVGAYDASRPHRPAARFSSRGPTADGRQKPELAAPGYRILAARSTPRGGWNGQSRLTVKSGTSMAAPWVSGTVALMFQAAGRALTIHEIRSLLVGSLQPHPGPTGSTSTRLGYGYLDPAAAVAAARRLGASAPAPGPATVTTPTAPAPPRAARSGGPARADLFEAQAELSPSTSAAGPRRFVHPVLEDADEPWLDDDEADDDAQSPRAADAWPDPEPTDDVSLEELHEALRERANGGW